MQPQKPKRSLPKAHPHPEHGRKKIEVPRRALKTECEDIIQGSLNSILAEIEEKGIGCPWSELEDQNPPASEEFDSDSQQLWSAFSLNSSFSKSHASTVDMHPPHPSPHAALSSHAPQAALSYYAPQAYYYDYAYKPYEEGALFQVFPEYIEKDARTTVMIRNIPNKYTIKELSEEIEVQFASSYDFLYLPCDIKNQCNVGYGFINFLSTDWLKAFYERFQGKKWARFRSEKVPPAPRRSATSPTRASRASTTSSSTSRTPRSRRTRSIAPSSASSHRSPTSSRVSSSSDFQSILHPTLTQHRLQGSSTPTDLHRLVTDLRRLINA